MKKILVDGMPRHNGIDTSIYAAESFSPEQLGKLRFKVLDLVRKAGRLGMTCDEVEDALAMRHQTASARIYELHYRYGLLHDSGTRRPTRSGRMAIVYIGKKPQKGK